VYFVSFAIHRTLALLAGLHPHNTTILLLNFYFMNVQICNNYTNSKRKIAAAAAAVAACSDGNSCSLVAVAVAVTAADESLRCRPAKRSLKYLFAY
jgi:hypothetical protein